MQQQFPVELLQQCIFLAGPTAVGKTETTLDLASRIPKLEIVSLDSMCIYRGMDIGTAKPTREVQQRIPHHLLDIRDPHEEFSVAEYVDAARTACQEIVARGSIPLFSGGTGLYLRAVLRGVFEGPPADWEIRNRLQAQADVAAERGDHFWLMRQLERVDVDAALKLHPNDQRRLIRAIEVFELTGETLSSQQKQQPLPAGQRPPHVYWLSPDRDWLHDRINLRVVAMINAGLVDEVRELMKCDHPIGKTAAQGLGYKEVVDVLEGDCDRDIVPEREAELVDLIQTRTRQFAKRQHTWYRNLEECVEVAVSENDTAVEVSGRLKNLILR
ncbi:MAG: tRNA (adenosine(37)-N6)-dimethylallyltransferase MiaA [Rhodopirellula sp.]|nr:tRNA (adenosine(37)-N6)-dimethylallyltransferase MiaA [Rhodopirellula sp.]